MIDQIVAIAYPYSCPESLEKIANVNTALLIFTLKYAK